MDNDVPITAATMQVADKQPPRSVIWILFGSLGYSRSRSSSATVVIASEYATSQHNDISRSLTSPFTCAELG